MNEPVFIVDGTSVRTTDWAAGPWNPRLIHGGTSTALIVRAAVAAETPVLMRVSRLTVDLLRPVPMGEFSVETEVIRQGRKIQLLKIWLLSSGVKVVRGVVLKIRITEPVEPDFELPSSLDAPLPDKVESAGLGIRSSFSSAFEARYVKGALRELGGATSWLHLETALVAGETLSGAARAVAVADLGSGFSAVLPWKA